MIKQATINGGHGATIEKLSVNGSKLMLNGKCFAYDSEYANCTDYTEFWKVTLVYNPDVWFLVARGYKGPRPIPNKETVLWFKNGKFWGGFKKTIAETVTAACQDAWKYI